MKILFNCTVNVVGGAVQNSANFINHALNDKSNKFVYVVSQAVGDVLLKWGRISDDVFVLESPARSKSSRDRLLQIERAFSPDVVYTMAGPTYVNFKSLHVMGISDPYITHADFMSLMLNRSVFEACRFGGVEFLKGIHARLCADFFLFQTETSRSGFCKRYLLPRSRSSILQNAVGEDFLNIDAGLKKISFDIIKIFIPSAYYPHKNLEVLFDVVSILKSKGLVNFEFITTVPPNSAFASRVDSFSLRSHIKNIGPYSYADANDLYKNMDVVFIPSILETFSTSYLEAIAMAKPLVVADRSFAREVCGAYASYYSPLSADAAAEALCHAISSEIDNSERMRILNTYGNQFQRFNRAISILEGFIAKGSYV